MIVLMVVLAILSGLSFAVQGPVNTALGKRTSSIQATAVSFFGGAVISGIIALIDKNGDIKNITQAHTWQVIGGMYGAIAVCVSILTIPVLGVALSMTSVMLGQLLTGVVIDYYGLLGAEKIAISPLRILGILVVGVGIILLYFANTPKSDSKKSVQNKTLFMVLISFGSGIIGAVQTLSNASLASIIGDWEGTFMSFVVGFVSAIIMLLIIQKGKVYPFKNADTSIWMYCGGFLGVGGIFLGLYTVFALGSALQVSGTMVGQLIGGLIIDSFGLIQSAKVKAGGLRIIGVAAITLGVIIVTISKGM